MRHAYIYYRVDPARADQAASRIDALLDAMAIHCAQTPRRLGRCDDPATWMEIYEGITDFARFSAALNMAVKKLDCSDFIQGARHLECFDDPGARPAGAD